MCGFICISIYMNDMYKLCVYSFQTHIFSQSSTAPSSSDLSIRLLFPFSAVLSATDFCSCSANLRFLYQLSLQSVQYLSVDFKVLSFSLSPQFSIIQQKEMNIAKQSLFVCRIDVPCKANNCTYKQYWCLQLFLLHTQIKDLHTCKVIFCLHK